MPARRFWDLDLFALPRMTRLVVMLCIRSLPSSSRCADFLNYQRAEASETFPELDGILPTFMFFFAGQQLLAGIALRMDL